MSRIDVELLLVVWVDEPQSALADSVACSGRQSFETFDGYTRGSYAHQFANVACRGSAYLQQAFGNHGVGSPDHFQESDISMLYYLSHSHFT